MAIQHWMAWEGGVDLVAMTQPGLTQPNVIVHVARKVHTPLGSAASGMVFFQPDPNAAPLALGFISTDPNGVGRYFGPKIFAGTPFEHAPVLLADINIQQLQPGSVTAIVTIGDLVIKTTLSQLGALELINRAPAAMPPFAQQGLEAVAGKAALNVNGKDIAITVPPIGISGGPAAVWTPAGIYAR